MSAKVWIPIALTTLAIGTAVSYVGCDNPIALQVAREHGAVRPGKARPVNFRIVGDQEAADAAIPALPHLDSITSIEISRVNLTDEQLEIIGKKTDIIRLELQDCGVDDEDLAYLSDLQNVSSLRLDQNLITDAGLRHLADMKRLHVLSLQATRISGPGLDTIEHFPNLTELNLNGTPIDDEGLNHLIQTKSRLRTLKLRSTSITVDGWPC